MQAMIGKYCVIRTYTAGVHIGVVEVIDGKNVLLKNARRLFYWKDAFSLSEVATKGVSSESRISCEVSEILLTEAIEIIPATEEAKTIILAIKNYEP